MRDYATAVADKFYIRSGRERIEVSGKVRRQFEDLLFEHIERNCREIKVRPVSIIFQNPETPYKRKNHRNGMTYIENSLAPVVRKLPTLNEGEYYEFPGVEFILERDGTGVIYLRRA